MTPTPHRREHRRHVWADAAIDVAATIAVACLLGLILTGYGNTATAAICAAIAALPILTGEPFALLRTWLRPAHHQERRHTTTTPHPNRRTTDHTHT